MLILAIDTALSACQAALVQDGRALAVASEPMERGHQERIGPLVQKLLAPSGVTPSEVDRVAVTVGPGSFTGLRVGIAFAKGIALGLGRPLVGVGTLACLAEGRTDRVAAVIPAPHGRIYLQTFFAGRAEEDPRLIEIAAAADGLRGRLDAVIGPGAEDFAPLVGAEPTPVDYPAPLALARLGALATPASTPLRPLYLREPDAKTIAERAAAKTAPA